MNTDPLKQAAEAFEQENQPEETVFDAAEVIAEEAVEDADDAAQVRVAELEAEVAGLKEKLLRTLAESDNVRKRAERDREDTAKYAVSNFARELVDVVENLMRAYSTIPEEEKASNAQLANLAQGLDMTMQLLLKALEKQGVRRIDPMGEKFDHNFHQAIAQVENEEVEPGTVIQVVQAGYVIHDRLLRPAMVAVAKAAAERVDTTA